MDDLELGRKIGKLEGLEQQIIQLRNRIVADLPDRYRGKRAALRELRRLDLWVGQELMRLWGGERV
jgi:hypothetical protein